MLRGDASDRSLFITWEGSEDFWGDHLIFRRTEGGISRSREPERGSLKKFWKDSGGGGTLKSAWTMPDMGGGGSRKLSIVMTGDRFNEITFKGVDRLNFTVFSPKSSDPLRRLLMTGSLVSFPTGQ